MATESYTRPVVLGRSSFRTQLLFGLPLAIGGGLAAMILFLSWITFQLDGYPVLTAVGAWGTVVALAIAIPAIITYFKGGGLLVSWFVSFTYAFVALIPGPYGRISDMTLVDLASVALMGGVITALLFGTIGFLVGTAASYFQENK